MCVCTHFTFVSLATIGVCVFCATASVAALFIFRGGEIMKLKFLELFNSHFHKVGDCCPVDRWNIFIKANFLGADYTLAMEYTKELLEKEYIQICEKPIGKCYEITLLGFENLF